MGGGMNGPVLFTPRLMLRPVGPQDLEPWIAFHDDPEVMRFLGGVQPRSVAWRGLCAMAGAWAINGHAMFAVIERATGAWVGRVGPWQPLDWPGTEIAWGIARGFEARGYAYEAARAATDFAVEVLGWTDIIHTIHPDNSRSIALAERLGARHRGPVTLPAPLTQMRVDAWGQSADEWRARARAMP